MKELELQPAIKAKIGSLVENALEIMLVLVDPHSLSGQEKFERLIYDFTHKVMQRGTGAMLNCTMGNPKVQ